MPTVFSVTSFVLTPFYDWTRPPEPPAVEVRAPAPPKKPRAPRCKGKPKLKPPARPKRKRKKKPRRLTPQAVSVFIDRLEAATLDGRIELCAEDMPCEALDFTLAELALLLSVLFPDEYRDPSAGRAAPAPTRTAPGSAARIAEYARRVARKRAVTARGDAGPVRADGVQLRTAERGNGSGVKVTGWAEERG